MTKNDKHRYDFVMNDSEHKVLVTLREKHSINISKCFKNFLRMYLEKLEKMGKII